MSRGKGSQTKPLTRANFFGGPLERKQLLEEYAAIGTVIDDLDAIETNLQLLHALEDDLRKAKRDIILDLDDTLSVNNTLYLQSRIALAKYLVNKCGKNEEYYLSLHAKIDEAMIPKWGFTPARWYESCRRLAQKSHGRVLRPGELAHVRRLAGIALGVGIPFPDTYDALRIAHKAGLKLVLKTKGEERLQQEKIMAHAFSPFFHGVHIVQAKTPQSMQEVAKQEGLNNPVMIGDSLKSDVLPAHEAGFGAVLMRYHQDIWQHENHPKHSLPEGVTTACCLSQALVHIAQGKVA